MPFPADLGQNHDILQSPLIFFSYVFAELLFKAKD